MHLSLITNQSSKTWNNYLKKLLIKAYKALQGSGHNIWYRGKRRESGREKNLDIVENR